MLNNISASFLPIPESFLSARLKYVPLHTQIRVGLKFYQQYTLKPCNCNPYISTCSRRKFKFCDQIQFINLRYEVASTFPFPCSGNSDVCVNKCLNVICFYIYLHVGLYLILLALVIA